MKKRFLSLLLCLVLLLGLLPTAAFATEGSATDKTIMLGTSGISDPVAPTDGSGSNALYTYDYVYFGNYQQSSYEPSTTPDQPAEGTVYTDSDGTKFVYVASPNNNLGNYFKIEPVKWLVLDDNNDYNTNSDAAGESALLLLSEKNLDQQEYHNLKTSITWKDSSLRSWLNGEASGNFLAAAFASGEQSAIATTYVVNEDNPTYHTEGGDNTTDKIFALSIAEAKKTAYGFTDNDNSTDRRRSTNTAYTASSNEMNGVGAADIWLLRSPGFDAYSVAGVNDNGGVDSHGDYVARDDWAARPAFNLNLNSVLFTSAAEGGKADAAVDGNLTAVETNETNEWKLTLLDNSSGRTSFWACAAGNATCTNTYGYSNWAVSIGYGHAITGENEYVSAMLVDSSNNILYYGRLKNAANTDDSGGNLSISIPAGLSAGTYTLKVFSEQCNGDYKTDYASAFQDVTLTVTKITPTLTLSANSGTVYSNADTTSFTYTYDGDGAVSAVSSDTEVATVSLDTENKTVTATILKAGKATITVSAADGTNFLDVNQTYALTVNQYVAPSHDDPSYSITVNEAEHGTVTSSRRYAERGDRVTLTVEPEKGWTLETLTVTNQNGKEIDLDIVEIGEKYTFKMPSGKVTVTATFMEDNTMLNYFVDVNAQDYFYDAVLWAAENGVTYGVDDIHFAPNEPCTRAQIVSFLWRAAGSPEPKSLNSFTDVAADSYYAKAVAWAVEKGITYGTGDGKFSPNATCTRAQAVTFLYRAAGSPAVSGYAEFDDVMTDAYYARAVAWATEQGVTEGVGSRRFAPDDTCTRGQIVTFLWRSQAD
jgi:hypothetical protein